MYTSCIKVTSKDILERKIMSRRAAFPTATNDRPSHNLTVLNFLETILEEYLC